MACSGFFTKTTWPNHKDSIAFILTSALPFIAFAVFGLYAALSPLFIDKLVPWKGPIVSGTTIASILLISAFTQIVIGRIPLHISGSSGLIALALSNALLIVNLWYISSIIFVVGILLTAVGHAMCLLAGMGMLNRIASHDNKSGLLSTYLVIGYLGCTLPLLAVGWITNHWGLNTAVSLFSSFVIIISSIFAFFFKRHPRIRSSPTVPENE